jgi:Fe-S-cluster containining protein
MPEPWYHKGLRFECTQCGHCCTGAPGFVWVDDSEIAALAAFRAESVEQVTALYTRAVQRKRSLRERANGDCIFYDRQKGCTVYPARPRQCRTWPFWESNLETPAAWKRTCDVCPGSGRGELISAEDITRRLNLISL